MRMPVREKSPRLRLTGSRIPLSLAVVLLLWAVTSCTGSSKPPTHTTTPASSATTISSAADPTSIVQSAVMSAYDSMWKDMAAAAKTANYQDPVLANHASGAALSTLVRGLYTYQHRGLVIMGTLVTHPRVTALSPSADATSATVIDCIDDTHWLVYKKTGGLENNVPGGHRRVTATLARLGGNWKVTVLDSGAEGSC